jgi:ribosome-associated protein
VGAIRITPRVTVDDSELLWAFSRAGGPGGQHVNTSSTKVELRWDVEATGALVDRQKAQVRERLGSRVTDDGVLVITSSEHRSQTRNREAALARFCALLSDALRVTKARRPTNPSAASRRRRLDSKRKRSETKALRRPPEVCAWQVTQSGGTGDRTSTRVNSIHVIENHMPYST